MSHKIVILDGHCLNPGDLSYAPFEAIAPTIVYPRTSPSELIARASDADILITNKTLITAADMERLPALRYIGVLATGYNVVDCDEARRRGIVVTNIPAYSTPSVVQSVWAHILNITQRVAHYAATIRRWPDASDFCYADTPLVELAGKTLGIVGMGNIGSAVAAVAPTFGMHVRAFTSKGRDQLPSYVEPCDLDDLFATADVLTLHCPLTPHTRHLVNAPRLNLMKPTAIIINTARGPLVDEAALADALRLGIVAAAGLDVLSTEPPSADNPLLTAPNCYITPHIAWATLEARKRLLAVAVANLKAYLDGHPQNVVSA